MLTLFLIDYDSALVVAILGAVGSISVAFIETVTDALLINQSRKDPVLGS